MDKKMNARKKAQRVARLRKQRSRRIALTFCLMIVVAFASIGGTLAWLTATTQEVKNTFTVGDIAIKLEETKQSDNTVLESGEEWSAQLIPGSTYTKNPVVTVIGSEDNVDCYLFVEFDPTVSKTYLDYTSAWEAEGQTTWTQLSANGVTPEVWYTTVTASSTDTSFLLIVNNTVAVKEGLLKADTDETTLSMPAADFTMTYTAYAVQQDNLTVEEAWNVAQGKDKNATT